MPIYQCVIEATGIMQINTCSYIKIR